MFWAGQTWCTDNTAWHSMPHKRVSDIDTFGSDLGFEAFSQTEVAPQGWHVLV